MSLINKSDKNQVQGEEVHRVLVDGRVFFGDDAALTLRNLPAEIIEQIEVYDRQSDQANFTGFNDQTGNRYQFDDSLYYGEDQNSIINNQQIGY